MSSNRISGYSSGQRITTGPRTPVRSKGERLDVALEKMRAAGEAVAIPDAEGFIEGLTGSANEDAADASLVSEIIECVIPRVTEPSIFRAGRPLLLLEYLRDEILPVMDDAPDLRELTRKVIEDEISRQRDILERLQSSIVA